MMNDSPTHTHEVERDGLILKVATPISIFDCPQPDCRRQAETAMARTYYDLEYINETVRQAQAAAAAAARRVKWWELVREAKQRGV